MTLRTDGSYIFPKSKVKIITTQVVSDKIDELFNVLKDVGYTDFEIVFNQGSGYDGEYPNIEYTFFDGEKALFDININRWGKELCNFQFTDYRFDEKYPDYVSGRMKIQDGTTLTDHSQLFPAIDSVINSIKTGVQTEKVSIY